MKWIVYNLLFLTVYPFLLPGFLLRMFRRGGYAARMGDRFALYPESVRRNFPFSPTHRYVPGEFVWIHAVSVGEVQVAGQLMRVWRRAEPKVRFVFSTTSSTGWMMAEKEIDRDRDVLVYNPLDFPTFVKAAIKTIRPRTIVLTESEIWPNFIRTAAKYRIPLYLINARVSDRSAPRYRAGRFFFREILSSFTHIFAQSDLDAERLIAAGAPKEKVGVYGSFKFDVAKRNEGKEREMRRWLGVENSDSKPLVLLGGSTWPGEDEALIDTYRKLKAKVESALLVIAPRHFEKADAVEANIRRAGYDCERRSCPSNAVRTGETVFLSDTTGELMGLYGVADIVFVGKSLCAHGSQNMIEPCLCGKPTLVGPNTENFRPVMSDLMAAKAIVQVQNAAELEACILDLAQNASRREELGAAASAAVSRRCGVVAKCVAEIRR